MAYNQNKLRKAVEGGFVPDAIRKSMAENNHVAGLYVVRKIDQGRVGVAYEQTDEETKATTKHVTYFTPEEIDEMLSERN